MASTLNVILRNDTGSAQLYAHITGQDDKGVMLLGSDGKTPYRPANPSNTLQPLGADCAIPIGASGTARTISVPRISGARIWFCKEKPLTFFINPGPALVEPSATNPADPNYDLDWGFCEFTWNQQELYANISFVDFVSLPISLQLKTGDGKVKTVPGMPSDGLDKVCSELEAQAKSDGKGWDKLVVRSSSGANLRALSPNSGGVLINGLFDGYYQSYVDSVWEKYTSEDLTLARTGPFAGGKDVTDEMLNIGARIAAAFNRSTLLVNANQPEGEKVDSYYKDAVTNHYSRICHQVSVQSRGYAFPYDDVGSSSGEDQSGFVNDPNPQELTVSVGKPLEG